MYSLRGKYARALVTGGAGFIGSHLVEELLRDGLEVISVDNYSAGNRDSLRPFHANPSFREEDCDVTDYQRLDGLMRGVDIVFHEAVSKNTVSLDNPLRDLEVNAQGTLTVLEVARKNGVRKFVHASTGSVYGEATYYPTDENHPLRPVSFYGTSKLAAENYVRLFHAFYGLDATMLRYYHVYGPRQDYSDVGGVVSIFGRKAIEDRKLVIFGDGNQLRSFTYVKDVVRINQLAALRPETAGQVYNCASGARVTIKELAQKVLRHFGKENLGIDFQDWKLGDIKVFDVDNSRLKALGFDFATDFDSGLKLTMDWLAEHLTSGRRG